MKINNCEICRFTEIELIRIGESLAKCTICKVKISRKYKKPYKLKTKFTGIGIGINKNGNHQKKRDKIFKRDNYKCVVCGTSDNLTIDHKLPKSLGGGNQHYNLQTMCVDHNLEKGNVYPYYNHEVEELDKWNKEVMSRLKTN